MKKARKRLLLILSLVLLFAASVSLSPAMAVSVNVYGFGDNGGDWYWLPGQDTIGTTSDAVDRTNAGFGTVKGYASTSGTVSLYAMTSGGWEVTAYAKLNDQYTFTNVSNVDASGTIPNLYMSIAYSGTLYAPEGALTTFSVGVGGAAIGAGHVGLYFSDPYYHLRTYAYDPSVGAYIDTISDAGGPTKSVSGAFIIPITASYGVPIDLTFDFKADTNKLGSNYNPYVDFFDTAGISFYTTEPGLLLGVTSDGGFNNVPLPGSALLFGSGLLGLLGWRRLRKS